MAVTADKVVVELELKDGQYLSRVRSNERAFTQAQSRVAKSAEDTERRVRASSVGIADALRGAAVGIAAGVSVATITKLGDTYTQLQNRLKVTGLEGAALAQQYERLNKVATDSRTDIESTVQVYARLRLATEGIGLTNEQVTRTTEILGKSLSASGATAQETSAALLQFSQAIGSGVLQGDELRSIRENAPAVARAIAKEFGVTVGELKKLGEEGKLVSERVVAAVLASGVEIDALFAKTEATVGNALTNLGNQLLNYVGQTDTSLSATERMAGAINALADNIDTVVPVIAALIGFIGTRYVAALAASTAATVSATVATNGLKAAMLGLAGGPIGLALTAVAALATGIGFLILRQSDAAVAARAQEKATAALLPTNTALEKLTRDLVGANEAETKSIREKIAALVDEARIKALNARNEFLAEKERERQITLTRQEMARTSGAPASAFVNAYGQSTIRQGGIGPNGNPIDIVNETNEMRELRAEAEALEKGYQSIAEAASDTTEAVRTLSSTEGDSKGPRGPSAETLARRAEQIRRRQEDVAADEALAIAQARNDRDAIVRIERENEIRTRQRDIIDAGNEGLIEARTVQQALTEATEAQARIDEARLEGQQKLVDARNLERNIMLAAIDEDADFLRKKERELELQELINLYKGIGFDETTATSAAESELLEIEQARAEANARRLADAEREDALTIARINAVTEGDQARIKALEDQEEILRRIALYTSADGGGLSRADAETRARREVGAIRSATNQAELRSDADLIAKTFVDGIRAGTLWEDLGQRFADAAANNLQQVLSQILQALASSNAGGNSFFGDALKFAATSFGGGRALGGPVRAGFSYDVGENGREKFVAPANGYIVPNMATANARSAGGGAMSVNINLAGANGDATIQRIAMQAARVGTAQAISQSRQDTANDKRLSRYRMGR